MTTDNDDNLEAFAHRARRVAITSEPTARDTRTLADALGVALEVLAATRRELAVVGRQVINLAERVAREREAHRETRRLVDALVAPPPTAFEIGARVFKDATTPALKHGPGGSGLAGPCDPDCAKCRAEAGVHVVSLNKHQTATIGRLDVVSAPRPADDSPAAWRADIRAALPESQRTHFDRGDFVECATCCTKAGMPSLCAHCLANRATVHALRAALREALDGWAVGESRSDVAGSKLARIAELRRLL